MLTGGAVGFKNFKVTDWAVLVIAQLKYCATHLSFTHVWTFAHVKNSELINAILKIQVHPILSVEAVADQP